MPEWDEWAEELSRQAGLAARAVRNGFVLHRAEDLSWQDDITPGDRWVLDDDDGYESFRDLNEVEEYLAADERLNGRTAGEEDDGEGVSLPSVTAKRTRKPGGAPQAGRASGDH